ncbi:toxin Doc [Streptomyces sp. NBC_00250]|uniref:toxin Doc n=1 Tax=unclassified Streptomyces TaxID=2593676 RepID=UPI002250D1BC|nr:MULTISPECIES: toxin Doc [unclassified Streptomyces]MCX4985785.1 toxin Doc [Streptomyces sp. NBC_00572]
MILHIDVPWLLDVQEQAVPEDVSVADYSALVAAVARHKTRIPRPTTADPDPAWRAAALLHTLIRLQPLPYRNSLYACQVTAAYMHASGEGIDPPYGAMVDLVRDVQSGKATVYQAADRIRTWRI